VAQQLLLAGAQHARVGQYHGADFLDALVDVEEHDEEHQRDTQRHLRAHAQAEPHCEDGRQDDARHGVERFDVGLQDGRGHGREGKPQAATQATNGPDGECQHRLGQGDPEVAVDVGIGDEPHPDAFHYL